MTQLLVLVSVFWSFVGLLVGVGFAWFFWVYRAPKPVALPAPAQPEDRLASWTVRIPKATVEQLERVALEVAKDFVRKHPDTPPGAVGIISVDPSAGVVWEIYPAEESPARPWLFVWDVGFTRGWEPCLHRNPVSFPESERAVV